MARSGSRSRRDGVAMAESRPIQVPASKAASESVARVAAVAAEVRLVERCGKRRRRRLNSRRESEACVVNQTKTNLEYFLHFK